MQANRSSAKNQSLPAVLAALLLTLVIGLGLLALGVNALTNPGIPFLQDTSAQAAGDLASATTGVAAGGAADGAAAVQMQELAAQYEARIQQYQAREQQYTDQLKQYQAREQQLNQQLSQAQGQAQQYQQVLVALQQAGIIQIGPDGQIFLTRGSRGNDD